MRRLAPYLVLIFFAGLFFWKFVVLGLIPIDSTAFYEMRPWSTWSGNPDDPSAEDTAKYYHNIDPVVEVLPVKIWMRERLRAGDLPLWNDAVFSGSPFAANHHAAPWDFSTPFFLLFPAEIAFSITLLLHLFIAGACAYFLCRVLEISAIPSLLGAAGFMLNSFFLHWLGLISFNAGLIWLPLIPAGIELSVRRSAMRYLLITGIALGLVFLSGMAQFWLFNVFLFFTYACYRIFTLRSFSTFKHRAIMLIVPLVIGAGLGAAQITQTVTALAYSSRGGSASNVYEGRNHLSPRRLPTLLIPDLYGHHEENAFSKLILKPPDPLAAGTTGRLIFGEKGSIFNRIWGYTGLFTIFLAAAGFFRLNAPFTYFRALAIFVLGFQILLCWTPFHNLCARIWPAFDTLDHTRTIVLYSLAVCVLAAECLNRLGEMKRKVLLLTGLPSIFLLLLVMSYVFLNVVQSSTQYTQSIQQFSDAESFYSPDFFIDAAEKIEAGIVESKKILIIPALLSSAWILMFILWFKGRLTTSTLSVLILTITVGDLAHRGWTDPPLEYTSRDRLYPAGSKVVEFLKNDPDIFRIYELHRKRPLPQPPLRNYTDLELIRKGSVRFFDFRSVEFLMRPNTAIPYRIDSAGGYLSLYPATYKELWQGRGMDILKAIREPSVNEWNASWIGMQNIKYLLVPQELNAGEWQPVFHAEGIKIFRVGSWTPRYYGVPEAIVIKDRRELNLRIKERSFDPSMIVFLEEDAGALNTGRDQFTAKIELVSRNPDQIHLKANFQSAGYLVIAENFFPGWKAKVNGKSYKIFRANSTFQAIKLPSGIHDVRMIFEPRYYTISLLCSFTFAVLILASVLVMKLRGRDALRALHE